MCKALWVNDATGVAGYTQRETLLVFRDARANVREMAMEYLV